MINQSAATRKPSGSAWPAGAVPTHWGHVGEG